MANKTSFIVPGIYSIEKDLSQIPAAAAALGAGFVGLTLKGPAFVPKRITDTQQFRAIFGGLWKQSYLPYAVNTYLINNGPVATVVRVLGKGDPNNGYTTDYGRAFILAFPTSGTAPGLTSSVSATYTGATGLAATTPLAVLRSRQTTYGTDNVSTVSITGTPQNFNIKIGSTLVTGLSLDRTQKNYIRNILGSNPQRAGGGDTASDVFVQTVLDYRIANFTGSVSGSVVGSSDNSVSGYSGLVSGNKYITGGYTGAQSPWVVSQPYYTGNTAKVYPLFQLKTLSDGAASNKEVKISITNVQTTSDNPQNPNIGLKFTVLVRSYYDTDRQPIIIESFRCDLDPTSDYYIGRVIGDRYPVTVISTPGGLPETTWSGENPNKSAYVRVVVTDPNDYPFNARPAGFQGIDGISFTSFLNQSADTDYPIKLNNLDQNNIITNRIYPGYLFEGSGAIGTNDRLDEMFTAPDATPSSRGFLMLCATGESPFYVASITALNNTLTASYNLVDVTLTGSAASTSGISTNTIQFSMPMFGGSDGIAPGVDKLEAINNGTLSAEYASALATLANPEEVDINLFLAPGVHCGASQYNGQFTTQGVQMCEDRGDAFYIMDAGLTTNSTTAALDSSVADIVANVQGYDTSYAAVYYPWLRILDTDINRLVWVPPSVLAAGVYAFSDSIAAPWYAPAGINRATLRTVIEARRRLTSDAKEILYPGRVNPITTRVNVGIFIDGQKTLQAIPSALDRVNVRRLLITVKKSLAALCYQVQYENNTPKLRTKLKSLLEPALQSVLLRQGIVRFQVTVDDSNNTPDTIDANQIRGTIIVEPARSAEYVILQYGITRTGANFTEIAQKLQ
jgi:hypothetical protein